MIGERISVGFRLSGFGFVLACRLVLPAAASAAPSKEFPEYELKAAYIFNFAKFVTWPSNAFTQAGSPMTVGILGDDPFGEHLANALADKTVSGRKLLIKHFKR